jgi:hypothetical protein
VECWALARALVGSGTYPPGGCPGCAVYRPCRLRRLPPDARPCHQPGDNRRPDGKANAACPPEPGPPPAALQRPGMFPWKTSHALTWSPASRYRGTVGARVITDTPGRLVPGRPGQRIRASTTLPSCLDHLPPTPTVLSHLICQAFAAGFVRSAGLVWSAPARVPGWNGYGSCLAPPGHPCPADSAAGSAGMAPRRSGSATWAKPSAVQTPT